MGIRDRLTAAKGWLWSPMTLSMLERGSETLVRTGGSAKLVVVVEGEDDGTPERIDVYLEMIGWGRDGKERWPLGEVPTTVGTHELEVTVPTGLAPSCMKYAEYSWGAELHRTKGAPSSAACPVDIVIGADELYWPPGERAGQDGPIAIEPDTEIVAEGERLTGRVVVHPSSQALKDKLTVELGPLVDTLVPVAGKTQPQPRERFKAVSSLELPTGQSVLPFELDVPRAMPPTLHNGGLTSVVWQLRVECGDASAWRTVGVLDPEASAGWGSRQEQSLASFLSSFS